MSQFLQRKLQYCEINFLPYILLVSLISSITVDVSDGTILSVLFFVCSNVRQERTVFVLSVTAVVQKIGSGDAVEYKWVGRSVLSEVGRRVGLVPSQLRFMIPKPAPF